MRSDKASLQAPGTRTTAGISAALAAGALLPSKGDAAVIINSDAVIAPDSDFIVIQFDHINGSISVYSSGGSQFGWNFLATGSELGKVFADNAYSYLGLNKLYTASATAFVFDSPAPPIDLANPVPIGTGYSLAWENDGFTTDPLPAVNDRIFVGLRKQVEADNYYGWSEFEIGSLNHIQTVFQTTPNTTLPLGQIPEPTSAALLLTAGLAGVSTFRRRRKLSATVPAAHD